MSPRVVPRDGARPKRSSLEEFRARSDGPGTVTTYPTAFWKYLTASDPYDIALHHEEQRALSRATGAAGGFTVPQDFADQIVAAARVQAVIGQLARTIGPTRDGRDLPLPSVPTHGVAAWTAENAAFTPSDETFGQTVLKAYKSTAKIIASEELVTDSALPVEEILAPEFGQRIAQLEEDAFVNGDGSGKPQGVLHASAGITTVTAATGSATTFTRADLVSLVMAVPAAYRARAAWVMAADGSRTSSRSRTRRVPWCSRRCRRTRQPCSPVRSM